MKLRLMSIKKRRFRISSPEDECVIRLQEYCNFSSILHKIPVIHKPLCTKSNCHNNVNKYVHNYGGERITGYYLITDVDEPKYGCAIYHSIWKNTYGNLIDITPFEDNREYNIFAAMSEENYYSGVVYDGNKYKTLDPGPNIV